MAATILGDALRDFELALDDLAGDFEFVRTAARLRPRLNDMLAWNNMGDDARSLATRFLKQELTQETVLYRGLVVSVAGAFGQLVRRIVRDVVSHAGTSAPSYDSLHETLKRQNTFRTGLALQTVVKPLDYQNLDYELLSKNIGTCFSGSKQPILNAEAFAIFLSIVSPEKLDEALERVGLNVDWDALGRNAELQEALDKRGTRESAKELQDFLIRFGQTRNKIAHTGSSGVVVSEADFEQLLKTFRIFARALTSFVETQLKKLWKP